MDIVIFVGILEGCIFGSAFLVFVIETERLPLTWRRWRPTQWVENGGYGSRGLTIGIRRRNSKIEIVTLDPAGPAFEDHLIAAENKARELCIQLNASNRKLQKRLPR
jgi:hypothetical protein